MRAALRYLFSINAVTLTLGSIIFVTILLFSQLPLFTLIELKTYDLRVRSRGQQQPGPSVVLAAIDEKSLDAEGHWPWPRARLAKLVDILSEDGARVISFDIGFLEPDRNAGLQLLDQLQQQLNALTVSDLVLNDFIKVNREYANNDRHLANAIKASSAAVILGYFFHMSQAEIGHQLEPRDIDKQLSQISASKYPLVMYSRPDTAETPFLKAYSPESNIAMISEAAEASGFFSLASDADGVIRWIPMAIQVGEDIYPPLAVMSVWHYLNKPKLVVQVGENGVEGVQMGDRFIPTDASGRLLINYLGPPKTFPQFSVGDILNKAFPPGAFRDKIVFVAATATGVYDVRSTPVGPVFPGGEVHATVADNILTRRFATQPSWAFLLDMLSIGVVSLLVGAVIPRTRAMGGVLFAVGLFLLYVSVANWLLVHYGVWLNLVYPLLALFTTYVVLSVYRYVTEERERQRIKGAFNQYVSPVVIEEVLKNPERLQLGGDERMLTVLFCDLQGFTSYAEHLSPHEMTEILSEYFNEMTEGIFAQEGTLLSYVGDEIVALFGAPIEQADHTAKACAAALDMRTRRIALNRVWAAQGRPPLYARTGLNTGLMLVGNLGSKYRFSYDVLGDHVNLGSRLEGMNKVYGTEILMSETTAAQVQEKFMMREIDLVRVVGREQPLRIYELVGMPGTILPPTQEQALRNYTAGLEAYRRQYWDDARGLFETALASWPKDGPSEAMLKRCHIYQHTAPPEGWDGVFDAQYK